MDQILNNASVKGTLADELLLSDNQDEENLLQSELEGLQLNYVYKEPIIQPNQEM